MTEQKAPYVCIFWLFEEMQRFKDAQQHNVPPRMLQQYKVGMPLSQVTPVFPNSPFTIKNPAISNPIFEGRILALGVAKADSQERWKWDGEVLGEVKEAPAEIKKIIDGVKAAERTFEDLGDAQIFWHHPKSLAALRKIRALEKRALEKDSKIVQKALNKLSHAERAIVLFAFNYFDHPELQKATTWQQVHDALHHYIERLEEVLAGRDESQPAAENRATTPGNAPASLTEDDALKTIKKIDENGIAAVNAEDKEKFKEYIALFEKAGREETFSDEEAAKLLWLMKVGKKYMHNTLSADQEGKKLLDLGEKLISEQKLKKEEFNHWLVDGGEGATVEEVHEGSAIKIRAPHILYERYAAFVGMDFITEMMDAGLSEDPKIMMNMLVRLLNIVGKR